jgi:hypothetical protein
MRHRLLAAAVTAVVLVAGLTAVAFAGRKPRPISQPTTLVYVSVATSVGGLDADPPGTSTGDTQTSSSRLMARGQRAGSLDATCSFALPRMICWGVIRLQPGQITIQGGLRQSVFTGGAGTLTIPITGGTGAYQHVHGFVRIEPLPSGKQRLTLQLEP